MLVCLLTYLFVCLCLLLLGTPIPKGDKKREAGSPSEAQQDVQKKTRHAKVPDQNTSLPAISEIGTDNDNCANKEDQVHYLLYPLNPVDIAEIAKELRALMAVDIKLSVKKAVKEATKGYFHMCPRMDFLQTLHITNSLYTNYENVFIELDS